MNNAVPPPKRRRLSTPFRQIITVAAVGYIVFAALSFSILRDFEDMFDSFGLNLSYQTTNVFALARLVRESPLLMIFPVLIAILVLALLTRLIWSIFPSLPLIGVLFQGGTRGLEQMAAFCETAATIRDEQPTAEAAKAALVNAATARRFSTALVDSAHAGKLPANVVMAMDESIAKPDAVAILRQSARQYRQRIRDREATYDDGVSPWLTMSIGIAVGYIVVAMFSPLVSLISGLS